MNETIRVEDDGEMLTLTQLSKKHNIPYSALIKRYRRGKPLLKPGKIGRPSSVWASIDGTAKQCVACLNKLPISEFHLSKAGRLGRHPKCKPCRGKSDYQNKLKSRMLSGHKDVVSCEKCERLTKRKTYTKLCVDCYGQHGL